jgi:protein-S-isoprenylcysteine O-methyltransferase Ste14
MKEFYALSAIFGGYAVIEFYFALRYKTKALNRKFDATFYAVTLPFFLIAMNPIYYFVRYQSAPDKTHFFLFISIFIAGMSIRFLGLNEIGRLFSQKIELREKHRVISTGIYRYIRHPLYLGSLVMAIGTVCYLVNVYAVVLFVLLLTGVFSRIRKEETYLIKNLEGYADYSRKTKRLFPMIF